MTMKVRCSRCASRDPLGVGVYEVMRAQWSKFVSSTGHYTGNSCWTYENREWEERSGQDWSNAGFSQSDSHPVVCVSWEDARAYVKWLSRGTAETYRLLSESEWEYVARAGTTTTFHFGSMISTDEANYDGKHTYGSGRKGRYRKKTVPVGSFAANRFGLHDVHGNVREWVADCWNESYHGAPRDGCARVRGDCSKRVLRGGSWNNLPRVLRSANRNRNSSGNRSNFIGFRIARTLTPRILTSLPLIGGPGDGDLWPISSGKVLSATARQLGPAVARAPCRHPRARSSSEE